MKTKGAKRRDSLPCPRCDSRVSTVVRSNTRGDYLQRIRRCVKCCRRFITNERSSKSDIGIGAFINAMELQKKLPHTSLTFRQKDNPTCTS